MVFDEDNSCITKEKDKLQVKDEVSKYISDTKSDLLIILPEFIENTLLAQSISDTIVSKKLRDNINIKVLYCYNENTRSVIRRISPFALIKRLDKPISDSYIFIRDSNNLLLIDPNKTDVHNFNDPKKIKKINFKGIDSDEKHRILQNMSIKDIDPLKTVYSNNPSLILAFSSLFNACWYQKEMFDTAVKEKSHSDLLVDLITHDIGNHHSIIQGCLDMMIEKSNNNKSQIDSENDFKNNILSYTSIIQDALDRSQNLVNNILKLEKMYRQDKVELNLINIPDVIYKAYKIVQNVGNLKATDYGKNKNDDNSNNDIDLNISLSDGYKSQDINIMADPLASEIFVNLFSNSIKYNKKNNKSVKIDIAISDYTLVNMDYWMITVSDYGIGIPDEVKDNLFERFYSKASGTGLGLSIARALVERYQGRIWIADRVSSSLNYGASIGMMFPKPE